MDRIEHSSIDIMLLARDLRHIHDEGHVTTHVFSFLQACLPFQPVLDLFFGRSIITAAILVVDHCRVRLCVGFVISVVSLRWSPFKGRTG